MAAVLEYLCAELLEVSGEVCKQAGKVRLVPRHLELAVRNDNELSRLFKDQTFLGAGTAPYVNPGVLKKKRTT